jgi:exo-1,4-beta-D-glucosaminidase
MARRAAVIVEALGCLMAAGVVAAASEARLLREGWAIQSSAEVQVGGEVISTSTFKPAGWHRARVPTTVVAALVADGTLPDPHFGMNLRSVPGVSYPIGQNFSNLEMPEDSPYRVPWWYRTEFAVPVEAKGRTHWLRLEGLNFRASIWINGRRVADSKQIAGASRVFELDVSQFIRAGETNALAIEVGAPTPADLAITFVDWNPAPPDKMMGLYRDVTLLTTGPVALRHAQVLSRVEQPSLARAELTVKVRVLNAAKRPVTGTLRGRIEAVSFSQEVKLEAGETREVRFAPKEHPQLVLQKPRLWWPWELGAANLYPLELEFAEGVAVSDRLRMQFGIREMSSETTAEGNLVFKVNGRRILIRGAGYTPEMLLRGTPERKEAEIRYVKDMRLNTIRLEGKVEDEQFFDVCDREGVLVMPGWCCCDHWEKWDKWDEEDHDIARASMRDQALRLRGRASVFVWLNGSDNPPPAKVEGAYIEALKEAEWPNPVVSSATEKRAELTGPSGVKMRGPYEWVPPIYWWQDKKLGGAHGFATEIGPGPAVPPLESLKRMLPPDHLWPIDEYWDYHCGGGAFKTLKVFTAALEGRYGPATGVEDYARKAQVAAYESHRAMFEAFGQHKYVSTGVIQWMLNNAWPSMIWHLYDFYLRPGGSYFGAKKACETLHVQYAPDDRSVVVVNSNPKAFPRMRVSARVLDLNAVEKFAKTENVDVAADGSHKVFAIPEVPDVGPTYFLKLALSGPDGKEASSNFYWLSTKPDVLDEAKSEWFVTPTVSYADLTGLSSLPPATIRATAKVDYGSSGGRVRVTLLNTSASIAFFVHASVRKGAGGEEVLPILWDDNYVSLLPGERRELVARYEMRDLARATPVVEVDGWNVAPSTATN